MFNSIFMIMTSDCLSRKYQEYTSYQLYPQLLNLVDKSSNLEDFVHIIGWQGWVGVAGSQRICHKRSTVLTAANKGEIQEWWITAQIRSPWSKGRGAFPVALLTPEIVAQVSWANYIYIGGSVWPRPRCRWQPLSAQTGRKKLDLHGKRYCNWVANREWFR